MLHNERQHTQAFQARLSKAVQFENDVEAFLRGRSGILSVAKNGTEHTHPGFVQLLRTRDDLGAILVRHEPDGVALTQAGVWEWEAKASINIEKLAYQTYMAHQAIGHRVLLFVRSGVDVYWQDVEKIEFVPSENVVGQYPAEKRHPIDADGWICPRLGSGYAGAGSGTPYKVIDLKSMRVIDDFYSAMAGNVIS